MLTRTTVISLLFSIGLAGCTWVKLTNEGEKVTAASSVNSACVKLGSTTSIGRSELASINRNAAKVATELETLARNRAAVMGGNTIVAQGPVSEQGQQTFSVYECP